ncbi:MAG: sulfurtransferase [Aliarcobacter sp.]|jgi:ferredoxin-thioredoxin reductase catalytic subunit/rhodanese-related sulfurtransferase|nr:sulfurtransferase [Aliarcobacter sp.]MDX9961597.1 ferredoxin-thioredoxin reductase catalytic domain-containing protein [Aliarcobacter sp.]
MIKKIDINSDEFQTELELTKQFTNNVLKEHGLVYNPDDEVNESIQMGLARNKMIYGKRFCPCFMVIGQTTQEQETSENRLCPCVPALTNEIPSKGSCHCGIFCTQEKADEIAKVSDTHDAIATHSRGLSKEECEKLLEKVEVNSQELESLLEARELGFVKFNLVDTREWMEWVGRRIVGTDYLIPTTSFYQAIEAINTQKETPVVVYCLSGSRSAYCQRIMKDLGFKSVANLDYGISSFSGLTESGDK